MGLLALGSPDHVVDRLQRLAYPSMPLLLAKWQQIFVYDLSDLVVPKVEGGRVGVRADQVRCQQPLQALEGRLHGPAHSSLQHLEGEAAPDHRRALQQLAVLLAQTAHTLPDDTLNGLWDRQTPGQLLAALRLARSARRHRLGHS